MSFLYDRIFGQPAQQPVEHEHVPQQGIDYDALQILMDECHTPDGGDPDAIAAAFDRLGAEGQGIVLADATMGPRIRAVHQAAGGGGGFLELAASMFDAGTESIRGAVTNARDTAIGAADTVYDTAAATTEQAIDLVQGLREYAASWWRGSQGEQGSQEEVEPPRIADVVHDDGFNESAAKRRIDEMMGAYHSVTVHTDAETELAIETQYRNNGTAYTGAVFQTDGFYDPVTDRYASKEAHFLDPDDERYAPSKHIEVEIARAAKTDSDYDALYRAIQGKASPAQMQAAVQLCIDKGAVKRDLGVENKDLTKKQIEEWSREKLGVDCIGFAWNVLLSDGQYSDFEPTRGDGTAAETDSDKLQDINCKHFMDSATDLTSSPASWRTLDCIVWSSHIILLYDVKEVEDEEEILHVETVESSRSDGPNANALYYRVGGNEKGDVWFSSLDEAKKDEGTPVARLPRDAKVMRPQSRPTEEAEA